MNTEIKVAVSLIAALVGGETLVRVSESSLSADVRQMLGYRRIPEQFAKAQAQGRFCVLVLGNSLGRAAVEEATFVAGLRERGFPDPLVCFLTPDASGINEWSAAYRRTFPKGKSGGRPDLLILFTGRSHLLDHPVASPEKLAAFHASRGDRGRILRDWLATTDERSRFVLALSSRLFANRERIRPLLFYRAVPCYEEFAELLNREGSLELREGTTEQGSASRFEWLLDSLELPFDQVIVEAAPLPVPYRLPADVEETARRRGVTVWRDPALKPWPPENFPDGYHLGKHASAEFTRDLLKALDKFQMTR